MSQKHAISSIHYQKNNQIGTLHVQRNNYQTDSQNSISQKLLQSPQNQPKCKTQQRAKTVLLQQSQTDRGQFLIKYDVRKKDSNKLVKAKKQAIFARSQQNKMDHLLKEEQIQIDKNLIYKSNIHEQKNVLNSYFLQSRGKCWNDRYKMRSESSQINQLQKVSRPKLSKRQDKQKTYKAFINLPQFGVMFPRRNSVNKAQKLKQFEAKEQRRRLKNRTLKNIYGPSLQNKSKRIEPIQALSLQVKKIINPQSNNQHFSISKLHQKVNSFMVSPSPVDELENQKRTQGHQDKNTKPIIIGYSNNNFLHRKTRNKSEGNLQNNFNKFNLRNILKRIKQMKTQQLLSKMLRQQMRMQNNLMKQSRRQQTREQNDIAEKLSQQRYKMIKNSNRLKSNKKFKCQDRTFKEQNLYTTKSHLLIQPYLKPQQVLQF